MIDSEQHGYGSGRVDKINDDVTLSLGIRGGWPEPELEGGGSY